jgi:hypothetical protein
MGFWGGNKGLWKWGGEGKNTLAYKHKNSSALK